MTSQELEAALFRVRWHQDQMSPKELAAQLYAIGQYPDFLLVLADGKIPAAPDGKNRFLVPIFTNPEARNTFLEWLPKDLIQQQIFVSEDGFSLFRRLSEQAIDGLVFNCLSQAPLAFVPSFCQLVLEQLDTTIDPIDELMQAAFPAQGQGGFAELDRLFLYLFSLSEWFFAVQPNEPSAPAIIHYDGQRRVFAFSSSQRACNFAKENHLARATGEVYFLAMETKAALKWLENGYNLDLLHFNFGGHGCFVPIRNLPLIRQKLGVS